MRIRSTKPDFWRSKTISVLPWDVRLVLKGLESYVDDNGVGKDDIALIAADVFPRDLSASPRETLTRLSAAISMLCEHGLIARYDVDGEDLLYIDRWNTLQRIDRPTKGRFPRPDGTWDYAEDVNRESYARPREDCTSPPANAASVTGEQGNRGTGEQPSSSEVADATSDREDVEALCSHLATRIEGNGSKRPSITKAWRDAARLMVDRDDRNLDEAHRLIDWCQTDEFWRTNILSMPKLREQYDKLRLRSNITLVRGTGTSTGASIRTADGKLHHPDDRPDAWTPLRAPADGETVKDQYLAHYAEIGWDHQGKRWIAADEAS